jgi:hypothetical protein
MKRILSHGRPFVQGLKGSERQSETAVLLAFFDPATGFLTAPNAMNRPTVLLYQVMDLAHKLHLPLLAVPATENFEAALQKALTEVPGAVRYANLLQEK